LLQSLATAAAPALAEEHELIAQWRPRVIADRVRAERRESVADRQRDVRQVIGEDELGLVSKLAELRFVSLLSELAIERV